MEEVLKYFNSTQRTKADWQRTLARHQRVADAVTARNGAGAQAAMLEHFEAADTRLAQLFPRASS
jgi:DNA-binding GntR family transcriptional regulator